MSDTKHSIGSWAFDWELCIGLYIVKDLLTPCMNLDDTAHDMGPWPWERPAMVENNLFRWHRIYLVILGNVLQPRPTCLLTKTPPVKQCFFTLFPPDQFPCKLFPQSAASRFASFSLARPNSSQGPARSSHPQPSF